MTRTIVTIFCLVVVGCDDPAMVPMADAAPDVAVDVAVDVQQDVPEKPAEPGSTEALLREACRGRARRGEPFRFAYSTAPEGIAGALRDMRPGDMEAVHLVVERPVRIDRLRLMFRGMTGGSVRVRVTDDYGRSNPDVERDLVDPVMVAFRDQEPMEIRLPRVLELHPARHAWVLVEHVTEPMGLAVAATRGGSWRSYFHSAAAIERLRAMGGDAATFRWVQLSGAMGTVLEYAVEAHGEAICDRQGAPWFTNITRQSGIMGTTNQTSAVDVDRDGWEDLVGTRSMEGMADAIQVWRNRHDGTFEDISTRLGLNAAVGRMSLWGDFDGDGDVDVYAGVYRDGAGPFTPRFQSRVWVQGVNGTFTMSDVDMEPAGPTAAGSVGDCDTDGRVDLAVGQWLRQYPRNPAPDFLFRATTGARFEDFSVMAGLPGRADGRPTYGMTFADYDNDGDQDLFVANYGGSANDLWVNDGRCRLVNLAGDLGVDSDGEGAPGTSFGFAVADYDNDGDLDAFETNIAHPRYEEIGTDHSRLLRNTGAPDYRFENVTREAGVLFTEGDISSAWGDYDNDGDLDLYVATTYPFQFSRLYRQEADHRLTDVTWLADVATEFNGRALWNDFDHDGDLDLITAPTGLWRLHRNDLRNNNHWVEITLAQPTGNTAALGARVTVRDGNGITRIREVGGGGSTWGTQHGSTVHVGLGASAGPLQITVRWPDNTRTEYGGLPADTRWRITRGSPPTR